MLSVADLLAKSREYIETHGWTRGEIRDPDTGAVCSLGGIECALQLEMAAHWNDEKWLSEYRDTRSKRFQETVAALCKALPGIPTPSSRRRAMGSVHVIRFNDEIAEDKQAVLDAFAKAEKIERAGFDPDA